jgi:putative lipoic acid-binding regulatory protein
MTDQLACDKQPAIEFPCDFPIKIVGEATEDFEQSVLGIVRKHFPKLSDGQLAQRASKQSKYLAFTVTVHAESQQQLDDLYQELSKSPKVIMVL